MAQIRQVVSESLQSTVRRLLPSQQGFTEDLQATNVITPIIDLTPSAEGSALPVDLARAASYGNLTSVDITGVTRSTIINNTGFWQVSLAATGLETTSTDNCALELYDGSAYKEFYDFRLSRLASGTGYRPIQPIFEFILFLAAGESLVGTVTTSNERIAGHFYQIADIQGNLVNPSGFVSQ